MVKQMENNNKLMKAAICPKYGPPEVLKIEEVEKPIPKDNEMLIKVHATTVTVADTTLRSGMKNFSSVVKFFARMMYGLRKPKSSIMGREFAGEIVSTGKKVTLFKKGDQVFGGIGANLGAYAEYLVLPEKMLSSKMLGDDVIIIKPKTISFEEAATVPIGGLTALHFLRKGNIQPGEKILVYGASGSVGTYAIQLAKYFGAEVTGVCSTQNLEMVKLLGATSVIDYTKDDFTKNRIIYDVIFDAVGKTTRSYCMNVLALNGRFITVNKGIMKKKLEDLNFLKELIEMGKLKSVVDRRYPLEKISEAHEYVEKGHKKGNVAIIL